MKKNGSAKDSYFTNVHNKSKGTKVESAVAGSFVFSIIRMMGYFMLD